MLLERCTQFLLLPPSRRHRCKRRRVYLSIWFPARLSGPTPTLEIMQADSPKQCKALGQGQALRRRQVEEARARHAVARGEPARRDAHSRTRAHCRGPDWGTTRNDADVERVFVAFQTLRLYYLLLLSRVRKVSLLRPSCMTRSASPAAKAARRSQRARARRSLKVPSWGRGPLGRPDVRGGRRGTAHRGGAWRTASRTQCIIRSRNCPQR